MQPAGIASMAARVDFGEDQDSGVARSSRAGTKRSVKARPTSLGCPGCSGRVPRIQTLRSPFFSSSVVIVAVDTAASVSTILESRLIEGSVRMAMVRAGGLWLALNASRSEEPGVG